MKRVLPVLIGISTLACAARHAAVTVPEDAGDAVGVYKTDIDDGSGRVRHVTSSVWAAAPDRLHAEISGPAGGVVYVLDAGAGRACLTDNGSGTAYVGPDDDSVIDALLGVRLSIQDAVAALLSGVAPDAVRVVREGASTPSLPQSLRLSDGTRTITMTLRRLARVPDPAALGHAEPPPRMRQRSLAELPAEGGLGKPPS